MTAAFDPNAAAAFEGIFGLPHTPEEARVVLVPVPWEATTSYARGTALGPSAILAASHQVDLFDIEYGTPYEAGISMLDVDPDILAWNAEACAAAEPVIAKGGAIDGDPELVARLERVNQLSVRVNDRVRAICQKYEGRDRIVGVIGGDHSSPFGAIAATAARFPGLGVLHLDAHADLRKAYEGFVFSHASIMYNVVTRIPAVSRLVQIGIRDLCEEEHQRILGEGDRITTVFDADIARRTLDGEPFSRVARAAIDKLPKDVYLSFDIDGLDPSLCPHTGTPVPGGLSFQQIAAVLALLVETGRRIVGFDLTEVAPGPDGDEWDGNVGARLLYKMIGATLRSQKA